MLILIMAMIFLCAGLVAWGFQRDSSSRANKAIQDRVYSELGSEEERRAAWIKALRPVVRLNRALGLEQKRNQLENYLTAGKVTLSQSEFLVIKELAAAAGVATYLATIGLRRFDPFIMSAVLAIAFFLPEVWLRYRISRRRRSIARDLPEVVDLLALCVEAGADFMNALQRVVREYRRCPLRDELALLLQEVRVGKRRREAFRSLANRVQVPEVTALSRTIIHADRMGTGMVQALRIMSEDCRLQRYHQAERFAQMAPLKMLIPMVFIMGSVLLVVAGPVMLQFIRGELFPKF
jgi:tight adherence protein C